MHNKTNADQTLSSKIRKIYRIWFWNVDDTSSYCTFKKTWQADEGEKQTKEPSASLYLKTAARKRWEKKWSPEMCK